MNLPYIIFADNMLCYYSESSTLFKYNFEVLQFSATLYFYSTKFQEKNSFLHYIYFKVAVTLIIYFIDTKSE